MSTESVINFYVELRRLELQAKGKGKGTNATMGTGLS